MVLVTVVIEKSRENAILVSGTLTLQKALLVKSCLNDSSHSHCSTSAGL